MKDKIIGVLLVLYAATTGATASLLLTWWINSSIATTPVAASAGVFLLIHTTHVLYIAIDQALYTKPDKHQ